MTTLGHRNARRWRRGEEGWKGGYDSETFPRVFRKKLHSPNSWISTHTCARIEDQSRPEIHSRLTTGQTSDHFWCNNPVPTKPQKLRVPALLHGWFQRDNPEYGTGRVAFRSIDDLCCDIDTLCSAVQSTRTVLLGIVPT